jgi:cobalt-zinc-cadmium efflux system outer membrane protein
MTGQRTYTEAPSRITPATPLTTIRQDEPDPTFPYVLLDPRLPRLLQQVRDPKLSDAKKKELYREIETLSHPPSEIGPPDGWTLEQAVDRLVRANFGIKIAAEDVCQARADRVTAGLRANPQVIAGVQQVPYGSFNTNVQGGPTLYAVGAAVPLDLSGKRLARVRGADLTALLADANYRDNVRKQIDNLYTAFIDALAAAYTLDLAPKGRSLPPSESGPDESSLAKSLSDAQDVALEKSRSLIELLDLPLPPSAMIAVRGTLRDVQDEPPPFQELRAVAMERRPDLAAQRFALARAQADLETFRANRFDDVTLTFTPYSFGNGQPYDQKSGTGWGVAVNVPTPLFNRQQGNILRACSEIRKQQLRLANLEKTVASEVWVARAKYESTRDEVRSLRASVEQLPTYFPRPGFAFGSIEEERLGREMNKRMNQDYQETLHKYQAAIVEHRKSMLRINTAVGWLVIPLSPTPGSAPSP